MHDLVYAVSTVRWHTTNSRKQHWKSMKWIIWFLRGTTKLGLEFRKVETRMPGILLDYIDADFGGDLDNAKAVNRICISSS